MTTSSSNDLKVTSNEVDRLIAEAKQGCVDRGEGRGRCHVFLDHSELCECGEVDLAKERMR